MNRPSGLSARLKLTLSYAGLVLVTGAVLLAVVWVFLLRYVPDNPQGLLGISPNRFLLSRIFGRAAAVAMALLLVFGLVGVDPRRPDARAAGTDHVRGAVGRARIAVPPDPHGRPPGRVP